MELGAIVAAALLLATPSVWADGSAPPAAFAPVMLHPVPARVQNQCELMRARASFAFPCPTRLPQPTIPARPGVPLPRLHAERYIYRDLGGKVYKLDIGYGAPTERRSWHNRPCCFLHFELLRRPASPVGVPSGARPAVLGGRHGLFKPSYSLTTTCGAGDRHLYWCNHVAFLWREHGQDWVATLHQFGPKETRKLLGRLIGTLRFG